MSIELVKLTPELASKWDEVIFNSQEGWLFSLSSWQKMITSILEWDHEDFSFAIRENGKLVAVMPLQLTKWGTLSSSAIGPAGPAILNDFSEKFRKKIFQAIFQHTQEIAKQTKAKKIKSE